MIVLQVSGAGYNDQGEIHIHKCDSVDRARDSIYSLLEVRIFNFIHELESKNYITEMK